MVSHPAHNGDAQPTATRVPPAITALQCGILLSVTQPDLTAANYRRIEGSQLYVSHQ